MTEPKYRDITKDMIPVYEDDNMKVHIIAGGEFKGLHGPLEVIETKPIFLDIELGPNREFIYDLDSSLKAFIFLVEGEANFNVNKEELISSPKGVLYGEGSSIKINTKDNKGRFFFY